MNVKLFGSLICVVLGLVIAISQTFQENWLSALSAFILGSSIGLAILLGFEATRESLYIQFFFALAGVLGVLAVFFEHRAFEPGRREAHNDVRDAFIQMQLACPIMSPKLSKIQEEGIFACAIQDQTEQMDAVVELQKAKTFGPTLSLVDSANALTKDADVDRCAEAFHAARPLCATAFLRVPESSQRLLMVKK